MTALGLNQSPRQKVFANIPFSWEPKLVQKGKTRQRFGLSLIGMYFGPPHPQKSSLGHIVDLHYNNYHQMNYGKILKICN